MESLLISTNLRGKYQYYVLLVVIFLPFTTFIISAGYPFLTYLPEVLCLPYQTSGKYYPCTLESYCRSASYGLVGIALGLFFLFVNKLKILLGINFFISVSLYFLVLAKFVESPRWLNSKNRMKDAIEALTHMAKTNNRKEEFDNFLKENNEVLDLSNIKIQEIKNTLSLKQILLLKSQRGRIISLTCLVLYISLFLWNIHNIKQNKNKYFFSFCIHFLRRNCCRND